MWSHTYVCSDIITKQQYIFNNSAAQKTDYVTEFETVNHSLFKFKYLDMKWEWNSVENQFI